MKIKENQIRQPRVTIRPLAAKILQGEIAILDNVNTHLALPLEESHAQKIGITAIIVYDKNLPGTSIEWRQTDSFLFSVCLTR